MVEVFDSDILEILEYWREKEIYVWEEDGKLKYKGKKEQISNDIISELRMKKDIFVNFFQRCKKNEFPLSSLQSAYLIGERSDCELGNTNAHYYIEFDSPSINAGKLEDIINILIEKHDALRMVVLKEDVNVILDKLPLYKLPVYSYINTETRIKVRNKWENHDYNPRRWPMFHFEVGQANNGNDVLHISFDCLILDAWSAKRLIDEMFKLYSGQSVDFPQLTFKNYMEKMKSYNYKLKKQAEAYWKEQLKTMTLYTLKTRIPIASIVNPVFARVEYIFSVKETKQLYDQIKKHKLTPAAALCLLFIKTLCEKFAMQGITLNVTLFNRISFDKNVDQVIGEFTNVGVVTYSMAESASLFQDAKNIQSQFWKLVQYREYDGTKLIKYLGNGSVGKAVLPIVYTCMLDGSESKGQSGFREVYALSKTPQVMLDHHVRDDLGKLKLSFDYVKGLFSQEDMQELMATYTQKVKSVISEFNWEDV